MKTVFTSSGLTPARCSAAWMTVAPRRGAGTCASEPKNAPIGVRAAPTMTTFLPWDAIALLLRGGRRRFITRNGLSSRSAEIIWAIVRAPMSYAGDLTAQEFDELLDRAGGPA